MLFRPARPAFVTAPGGGADQDAEREDEDGEHRELDLVRLDALAEVFGRAPDHETCDEDREDDEEEHPVEPRTDAAEDDLAELDVHERDEAAEWREGIVHGVHRAARGVRRDRRKEGRVDGPEADLLALHVPRRARRRRARGGSALPRTSAKPATRAPPRKNSAIVQKTAQPCRGLPVILPSVTVRPAGIAKMRNIWRRFVKGVGFSYGWVEFALKKPPPFVPSILIASCEAIGPPGIF